MGINARAKTCYEHLLTDCGCKVIYLCDVLIASGNKTYLPMSQSHDHSLTTLCWKTTAYPWSWLMVIR